MGQRGGGRAGEGRGGGGGAVRRRGGHPRRRQRKVVRRAFLPVHRQSDDIPVVRAVQVRAVHYCAEDRGGSCAVLGGV